MCVLERFLEWALRYVIFYVVLCVCFAFGAQNNREFLRHVRANSATRSLGVQWCLLAIFLVRNNDNKIRAVCARVNNVVRLCFLFCSPEEENRTCLLWEWGCCRWWCWGHKKYTFFVYWKVAYSDVRWSVVWCVVPTYVSSAVDRAEQSVWWCGVASYLAWQTPLLSVAYVVRVCVRIILSLTCEERLPPLSITFSMSCSVMSCSKDQ